jgi:hypothetical protein
LRVTHEHGSIADQRGLPALADHISSVIMIVCRPHRRRKPQKAAQPAIVSRIVTHPSKYERVRPVPPPDPEAEAKAAAFMARMIRPR